MLKRINEHLRIHYPLVWNIRLVWMVAANLAIHLLYLICGFLSVRAEDFQEHRSVSNVGGGGLYTLSVLCSLLTIIVWLIYYLRNNALKQHYRVSKWYGAKEFLLLLLIVFLSISYFISFEHGVRLKVRAITPFTQYVEEVNTINLAKAFIPTNKEEYFLLNTCRSDQADYNDYTTNTYHSFPSMDTSRAEVREALRRPDAFSYRNYCQLLLPGAEHPQVVNREQMLRRKAQWLNQGRKDSIRHYLQGFVALLKKYNLDHRLHIDSLVELPFPDPNHPVSVIIPSTREYTARDGNTYTYDTYLLDYPLSTTYYMLEESMPGSENRTAQWMQICITLYVALALSVLVWCYRRFSRKVFLISLVGSIVWAIFIGLVSSMNRSFDSFAGICIALCLAFLLLAIFQMGWGGRKTPAGVSLNWHCYLAPFLGLFILALLNEKYADLKYRLSNKTDGDAWMAQHHPVLHWVHNHGELIAAVNLVLAVLYFTFLMNRLALQWQVKKEE